MKTYKINFEENGTLQMCQLKVKNEDVVTLFPHQDCQITIEFKKDE